ncbi:MAG: glucose-6-phosphate isomerase [Peptococcaceae bacterium]
MTVSWTWQRYKRYLCRTPEVGLKIDISRMMFSPDYFTAMAGKIEQMFSEMEKLEQGAVQNPDEGRRVGHYWLRDPELAPEPSLTAEIRGTVAKIKDFARQIHEGNIKSFTGNKFTKILLLGIGGSALGPQFVADALRAPADKMEFYCLDNTDPAGFDRIFYDLAGTLSETLVIVISKSGGTIETRNSLLETQHIFKTNGLSFSRHAVAVTQKGSKLHTTAAAEGWLEVFPLWDWVGGRTSETSAVGLLTAALQGIAIDELMEGAGQCDRLTRSRDVSANPAALLALMWYYASGGQGGKTMVILPYKDRLQLFSKYLQQLVMESLGKERDLDNMVVNQGLAVFGNKGSTDQHSYLQQILDGPRNIFAVFIEILKDRQGFSVEVEDSVTSGDYLNAFLHATKRALTEKGKESVTITVKEVNPFTVGVLIALFERAVGYYGFLVNINAYHQPAVEAGKKGARLAVELQKKIFNFLKANADRQLSIEELARELNVEGQEEIICNILEHAAANGDHNVIAIADKPYTYAYKSNFHLK